MGGEAKQPNTSATTTLHFLQPGISLGTIRDTFLTTNSFSPPQKDFKRSPNEWYRGGSWASTGGPEASSTHLGLLPQPTTELNYVLGTVGKNKQKDNKWTWGRQRERFLFPGGFSFSCNKLEDLHRLCPLQCKNKTKPNHTMNMSGFG